MLKRKSDAFLVFLLVSGLLLCIMFVHAAVRQAMDKPVIAESGEIVKVLELTDLCLFTEARYTRHPTMADLNTPFQDYPLSLEHFPSGSIVAVPPHFKPARAEVQR
jgi:hypothetical protein